MLISIWDEVIPGRLLAADPLAVDAECVTVRELVRARAAQHGFAESRFVVEVDGRRCIDLDEQVRLREGSDVQFLKSPVT